MCWKVRGEAKPFKMQHDCTLISKLLAIADEMEEVIIAFAE
jgi:hypothetical protein